MKQLFNKYGRIVWAVIVLAYGPLKGYAQAPVLSFPTGTYTYGINTAINPLTPANSGGASTSFSISPALSAGLNFNGANGTISGTPSAAPPVTYTVTAYNGSGSGSAQVQLIIAAAGSFSPSVAQNYIATYSPRFPGIISNAAVASASVDKVQEETTIAYMDGLGRPVQTVQVKGSPLGMDVVLPAAYDVMGRETMRYLPYTAISSDGSYKSDALAAGSGVFGFYNPAGSAGSQLASGVARIASPYSATNFDASQLNRVVEQGAPGNPWQLSNSGIAGSGHTAKLAYGTNAADVILWTVNPGGTGATGTTNYPAGALYATTSTDEMGNNAITYKDLMDRIVCKKAQLGGTYLATYYVYNSQDHLQYVIPPIPASVTYPTSFAETDLVFINFIYGYHYDNRNRLAQKKIPGKGWEFIVYNALGQVAMTQDANQRNNTPQQWSYTKYDAIGRVIITGQWNQVNSAGDASIPSPGTAGLTTLQSNYDANISPNWETVTPSVTGYTNVSLPTDAPAIYYTINYYDDYSFSGRPSTVAAPANASLRTRGLLTATKTMVLNTIGNTTPDMLWTVHYYDDLGRLTQTYAQHYLGGILSPYNYDVVISSYDFINELTGATRQHYAANAGNTGQVLNATIVTGYSFDHIGRKIQTTEQINGGPKVLLAQQDYNEVGQLQAKHLHSTTGGAPFLQDIIYKYNERGWLKRINDPAMAPSSTRLFSEQLNYDSLLYSSQPMYNGNIAEQDYSAGISSRQNVVYTYDALNRLTSGISAAYSETGISYDYLGNLLSLNRSGTGTFTLTYTYADPNTLLSTGNQLYAIGGSRNGIYRYDVNGNVYNDGSRNAYFSYNLLNLPKSVVIPGTSNVTYTYDANGQKLRKVSSTNSTIDYVGGIQYTGGTTAIDFIQTEEGRAINSGGSYNYEYTLTDHLGNNRVTFDVSHGKVSENHYYPFGSNAPLSQFSSNNYLYNKKELQPEITEYDYGARFYDPVIARWNTIDPLAEINRKLSPYSYVKNNPLRFIDPDGMSDLDAIGRKRFDENGMYIAPQDRGEANIESLVKQNQEQEDDNSEESKGPTWSSKYGFHVHQHANRVGLYRGKNNPNDPELTTELDELDAGTEYADSDPFQTGNNSYRHAMRNSNQTVAQAKNEADAFVRKQFALAKKLKAEGKVAAAYYQFAIGLHTLQDATSPAHAGFQEWSDHPSATQVYNHVTQELFYPGENSNLQKVTNQYLDWFQKSNAPLPSGNLFDGIKHD